MDTFFCPIGVRIRGFNTEGHLSNFLQLQIRGVPLYIILLYVAHKVNSTQEDISGGEVTMDDPLCLEILHGVCNLSGVGVEHFQVLAGSILPQECVEIT